MKKVLGLIFFVLYSCNVTKIEHCDYLDGSKKEQRKIVINKLDSIYGNEKYRIIDTQCIFDSVFQVRLKHDTHFDKLINFNEDFNVENIIYIGEELY